MKKVSLIIALLVVTIGGSAFGQSIAHINSGLVLDTMPSSKLAIKELQKFEEKAVREIQTTQQGLQDDYMKLQKEKATMSPTAYKFEEDRLVRKSQDLQERQMELEQQMKVLGSELNAPILEKVQKAIEKIAKEEKVDYVLDESSLLYFNGKDITDKVIKEVLKMEKEATSANSSN